MYYRRMLVGRARARGTSSDDGPSTITRSEQGRCKSDLVKKEVDEGLSAFVANVQIMQGHARGTTALPLPPDWAVSEKYHSFVRCARRTFDAKDAIHALESAIITWTKQIKAGLEGGPGGVDLLMKIHIPVRSRS